jgi:hypothetical protein
MPTKPYKPGDLARVVEAIAILSQARCLLSQAGARQAARRVRWALMSAARAKHQVLRRLEHSAPNTTLAEARTPNPPRGQS